MYHEFFSGKGILQLPILAMVFFLVTFSGIVWSVLRRAGDTAARTREDQEMAQLPLLDDDDARRIRHE